MEVATTGPDHDEDWHGDGLFDGGKPCDRRGRAAGCAVVAEFDSVCAGLVGQECVLWTEASDF